MKRIDKPLFVYGSMLDRDVSEVVLGRPLDPARVRTAWLPDHRRLRIPEEDYPILAPAPGEHVPGALLYDLTEADLDRVRYFESYEYALETRSVIESGRGPVLALMNGAAVEEPQASEPWDLESWQRTRKDRFMYLTRRFMSLYGRASREEADALWDRLNERRGERPVRTD